MTEPGRRFALLVVLGIALLATPLAEAWRRLGLELQATADARRSLEPVAMAARTQQALISHRPFAAAVLSGRGEQEPERLRRQRDVDGGLAALLTSLEARRLGRALHETDQLRHDWLALLQGIGVRQVRASVSDAAHDLLVEQTFVIVDLATGASGLLGQAGRAFDPTQLMLATHLLPRLASRLAAGRPAESHAERLTPTGAGVSAQMRLAEREVADALAALATAEPVAAPHVATALTILERELNQARSQPADPEQATRVARACIEAASAMLVHFDERLALTAEVLRLERALVAVALCAALILGALAANSAVPRACQCEEICDSATVEGLATPESALSVAGALARPQSAVAASDLLQRLRRREDQAAGSVPPEPPPRS